MKTEIITRRCLSKRYPLRKALEGLNIELCRRSVVNRVIRNNVEKSTKVTEVRMR